MEAVVRPGLRLGTSLFFPGTWTGWKDTAEGANSRRVLIWLIFRETKGWTGPFSLWHLAQTSYSNLAAGMEDPAALTPAIWPSLGEMVGAAAVPDFIVWGSWQSEQWALVGACWARLTGGSVSWRLILFKSAAM